MDDPASVKSDAATHRSRNGSAAHDHEGALAFANDVVTLAELQVRLAAVNSGEAVHHAKLPIAVIAVGLVIVAGAVPVALLGAAKLIASALPIKEGWAMIATAGVAAAAAGSAAALGAARVRRSLESFRASREELERNLAWLHAVLDPGERSHRR